MAGIIISQAFYKKTKTFSEKEQRTIMDVVLRLNMNAKGAGLHFERLRVGKWSSVRVTDDIRIILEKQKNGDLVLCHVDRHDKAYQWAQRHSLKEHPTTGTMQLVEICEVREEKVVHARARSLAEKTGYAKEDLLKFGVPEAWVERVWGATDADELINFAESHLPPEAWEFVLNLADGVKVPVPEPVKATPWTTEDAKRSWHVFTDDEDLKRALNESWDVWTTFLHPSQRSIAEKEYTGAVRVSGSAGTGKTVVALHHANYLLRNKPGHVVLMATFTENLQLDLANRAGALMKARDLERCDFRVLRDFGAQVLDKVMSGHLRVGKPDEIEDIVKVAIEANKEKLPKDLAGTFVLSEWSHVVDERDLRTWDAYRDAIRRGCGYKLSEARRKVLWDIFEDARARIKAAGLMSAGECFGLLAEWFAAHPEAVRNYDYVVVDEAQDIGEAELKFLSAYAGSDKGKLFFAGDVGQRVARYPFAWSKYGVDVRGRSKVLKVNYRTTKEIRVLADKLLDETSRDADGNVDERKGTISILKGPSPELKGFSDVDEEVKAVAGWIDALAREKNLKAHELAIFYRSDKERERAVAALKRSVFANSHDPRLDTMLKAKGLEYKAVVVMGCDHDVLPSMERLSEAGIVAPYDDIVETERNLLYVACTRARDYLLVTWVGTGSDFLLDMTM